MSRVDFNEETRRIIASRSGYRCSFPGCNKTLIGPGKEMNQTVLIGECAHIYSAAEGGPRKQGDLTEEQLSSPKNGIFLCRNHHKIIDANWGNKYSPELLLSFKSRHENLISKELGDYPITINWINSITIKSHEAFNHQLRFNLGKVTHFYGDNCSGKTLICKLIYEAITQKGISDNDGDFIIDIEFQGSNTDKSRTVTCKRNYNEVSYFEDNNQLPFLPFNLNIIFLRKVFEINKDQVKAIADCYCIDEKLVLAVLKDSIFEELGYKIKVVTTREKPYLIRKIKIDDGKGFFLDLNHCSGAEIGTFVVEVGLIIAKYLSHKSAVLFVIDWGNIGCFDEKYMKKLIGRLQSYEDIFQSIVVAPDKISLFEWNGWQIAQFNNMVPNTVINQNLQFCY